MEFSINTKLLWDDFIMGIELGWMSVKRSYKVPKQHSHMGPSWAQLWPNWECCLGYQGQMIFSSMLTFDRIESWTVRFIFYHLQ